jgi:hypothetical protein
LVPDAPRQKTMPAKTTQICQSAFFVIVPFEDHRYEPHRGRRARRAATRRLAWSLKSVGEGWTVTYNRWIEKSTHGWST